MTWQPMDTLLSPDSTNTSLHDSGSGLGKAILAIHGKSTKPLAKEGETSSVSVSSFSEAGFMADVSESDYTSASEVSDYFSESATECLSAAVSSSSMLAAHPKRPTNKPKRKVKRKAGQKKKSAVSDSTAPKQTKPKPPRKKPEQQKKKKVSHDKYKGYFHDEFNTSKRLTGISMEDFMTDSSATDNERPATRRKKNVKRSVSCDHSSSKLSMADGSRNSQGTRRGGAVTDTEKPKRSAPKKVLRRASTPGEKSFMSDASNQSIPHKKAGKTKRRVSNKGKAPTTRKAPAVKKDHPVVDDDDATSFAEDSLNDSLNLEQALLSPPALAINPIIQRMEQSTSTLEKEASLDLAKHGGHKTRELMADALLNPNVRTTGHRGRSLSPETKRRQAAGKDQQATSTSANAKPKTATQPTTTTSAKPKSRQPRRMKSQQDPSSESTKTKPLRRTKSDGAGDPEGAPKRTRTPSKNRRPPKTSANHPTAKAKQRSQSLNLVSHPAICKNNAQRRTGRLHASETSPGGTSKISVSVSINTMDRSVQSMPSNPSRTGRRASSGSLAPPPPPLGRTKSTEGTKKKKPPIQRNQTTDALSRSAKSTACVRRTHSPLSKSAKSTASARRVNSDALSKSAKSTASVRRMNSKDNTDALSKSAKSTGSVRRMNSKDNTDALSKSAKSTGSVRKKKPTKGPANKAPTNQIKKAKAELPEEDESIVSMSERTRTSESSSLAAGSLLSGHIAKDSTGRNNLDRPQRNKDPISPFSMRSEESGPSMAGDSVSKSEASTINSGASSITKTSAASGSSSLKKGLAKTIMPPKRPSARTPISSYFGREDDGHNNTDSMEESFSGSMAGSLLTDYSSSDEGSSRAKKYQNSALFSTDPGALLQSSSGDMSFDTTKGRTPVISPFSAHAGDVLASNHTATTTLLLPTEHSTATPLIPDSDDEDEDHSFHLETPKSKPKPKPLSTPKPLSAQVDEGPPPTPRAPPKETTVSYLDDDDIPETPKAKQPKIVLPVSTPQVKKKKESSKKEPSKKELEDDEFADPVPKKSVAHNKSKGSFWGALCCRSTHAVAT